MEAPSQPVVGRGGCGGPQLHGHRRTSVGEDPQGLLEVGVVQQEDRAVVGEGVRRGGRKDQAELLDEPIEGELYLAGAVRRGPRGGGRRRAGQDPAFGDPSLAEQAQAVALSSQLAAHHGDASQPAQQESAAEEELAEEVEELRVEIAAGDKEKAREELGDLLFVVANLARKLEVEPEDALRAANAKFVRRFEFIEAELAKDGRTPEQSDLPEMDALWDAAKAAERA